MAEFNTKMNGAAAAAAAFNVQSKRKGQSLTRKCAALVKEQRARIYILRRCATMLCCWYIQGED